MKKPRRRSGQKPRARAGRLAPVATAPTVKRQADAGLGLEQPALRLAVTANKLEPMVLLAACANEAERGDLAADIVQAVEAVGRGKDLPNRDAWLYAFRSGTQTTIDEAGAIVLLTSERAALALALLTLEGSREWQRRLRRCPYEDCGRFFTYEKGRRVACSPEHASLNETQHAAERQRRHRRRDPVRYREKQRAVYQRAKIKQRPWT